ncbi:hypothetical protein AVEN_116777-1 [Araneus ventricosus]|uniref:Uncharacterized protein n=1 Tax=Araneus ventricosus TaxID=182803 RepID=A0A4Y2D8W3_ARAVE|nr:hypothetical protein AVEN_116777-1 [Araneus ventricosus]
MSEIIVRSVQREREESQTTIYFDDCSPLKPIPMPSLVIHPRFRRDPNPTFPIGLLGGYNGLEQGITIPIPRSSSALILAGIIDGADQGLKTDDIVSVTRLDTCSRCHWLLTKTVKLPFRCTH